MTELLPSLQAARLMEGLTDFLVTSFSLADAEPRRAFADFLADEQDGIFKGPYVRLRLPFEAADPNATDALEWTPPFPPYRHQALAYERLTTKDLGPGKPRPLPTIVTTGTGSGKTEAFLNPIIDAVLRARRDGVTGMKALILYPMNALADDQALRLTKLITGDPALAHITAGIYTGDAADGQSGQGRTKVTPDGLITNRTVMQQDPPDILLTNYKMLDQLLLRSNDREIWEKSALSLQYLVLDEFHTYDGAQGTDVSMLLRRLGLTIRDIVARKFPDHVDAFAERPLGQITPVATSATLGDGGDPGAMLAFAESVFGETFAPDAAITETRQDVETFAAAATATIERDGLTPRRWAELFSVELQALAQIGREDAADATHLTDAVARVLYGLEPDDALPHDAATLLTAHTDVKALVSATATAQPLNDLASRHFPQLSRLDGGTALGAQALSTILAALSHVRAVSKDRNAISVDVTLWVRELSRIDRQVGSVPVFHWGDDGDLVLTESGEVIPMLPAIYCRSCGRSGWGVTLASTGRNLTPNDNTIRHDHVRKTGRFRALLHAPGEAIAVDEARLEGRPHPESVAPSLRWLDFEARTITVERPSTEDANRDANLVPVVMLDGDSTEIAEASNKDVCPSCGHKDSIRFLGRAINTLLSTSLSTLFGDPALNDREKRSLVFTDSVQDAAHRAGFVEARSYNMSLRAGLRAGLDRALTLPEWVDAAMRVADPNPFTRFRFVPPTLLQHPSFVAYWDVPTGKKVPAAARTAVSKRLQFDAALDIGLFSTFGRTLTATGSVAAHTDTGPAGRLRDAARRALQQATAQTFEDDTFAASDESVTAWARGVLERMQREGAIDHPWMKNYIHNDGARIFLWGKRPRKEGCPAFPRGRAIPVFPTTAASVVKSSEFSRIGHSQSWYARWAMKTLGVSPGHGSALTRRLMDELAADGILRAHPTGSGATVYAIPPERIVVTPLDEADHAEKTTLLVCDTCWTPTPVAPVISTELSGARCVSDRCTGTLKPTRMGGDSFYRALYNGLDVRRINAAEHTSMLEGRVRREIEAGFKSPEQKASDPNVLVATPTLEMGIDIGDLNTVMLSSLPDSVAAYQQRVGRAGRATGSALALAYITGRGENLPRLGDPTSMISGAVRPPATYLDAEEILRRQFMASIIDDLVRSGYTIGVRTAQDVLASAEPGTFLGTVVAHVKAHGERLAEQFTSTFPNPNAPGMVQLREWARQDVGEDGTPAPGPIHAIYRAVRENDAEISDLHRRLKDVTEALPALKATAESAVATDDDKNAYRSARATKYLIQQTLGDLTTGTPWINALERRGLLPNYTLLDDRVELDVHRAWVDPESGEFKRDKPLTLPRGASRALTEFAPGATFYAHGMAMRVDGIELNPEGADVQEHLICGTCSYSVALHATQARPSTCPRCGDPHIVDTDQRFSVVRLKRVFSELRDDSAQIDDASDERIRLRFEQLTTADFDPQNVQRMWSVGSAGLGVTHYRRLPMRWYNLGRSGHAGEKRLLSGREVGAEQFRVCGACGKLDEESGANSPREHRAWCPHRKALTEDHVKELVLCRDLVTQGVAIEVPAHLLGEEAGAASLSASLLLGLRELLGGAPRHLRVEMVTHPAPGYTGEAAPALLIHDTVPGGTGYLTELATPQRLWSLMRASAELLEECACVGEGRLACHRCLLPYQAPGTKVSRGVGLRILRTLLEADDAASVKELPDAPLWDVDLAALASTHESPLETQFREAFEARVSTLGMVTRTAVPEGTELQVSGLGPDLWNLRPQVSMDMVRPDFVLSGAGRRVAVFTDGYAYHASSSHNRLADDAEKRQALLDQGYNVIAVTAEDLSGPDAPQWAADMVGRSMMAAGGTGITLNALAEHRDGALGLLEAFMREPDSAPRRQFADHLGIALMLAPGSGWRHTTAACDDTVDLFDVAARLAQGEADLQLGGGAQSVSMFHRPHLAAVVRYNADMKPVSIVLALDDAEDAVADATFKEAWAEWLRLSNVLTFADCQVSITTTSLVAKQRKTVRPAPATAARSDLLASEWEGLEIEYVDPAVVALVPPLSQTDVPRPEVGLEVAGGATVELAWPQQRVAVVYADMPSDEVTEIERDGWVVIRAGENPNKVVETIRFHVLDAKE